MTLKQTVDEISAKPILAAARINALDVIRGIALLGILLMNINGMGLPFSYSDPTIAGGADGLNLQVWIVNNMLFEGTMRGLFTLLFGAGVILLTDRLEKNGIGITTADIYYRRILWLLLFGIINVYVFLWDGDILYPYAIFALMLFPFRNAQVKTLIVLSSILITLGVLWDVSDYHSKLSLQNEVALFNEIKNQGIELTKKQTESIDEWEKFKTKKTSVEVNEQIDKMHQGYFAVMMEKVKGNQFMQTWLPYRLWVWDILSFMLLGMAFFKLKIFHAKKSNKFYIMLLGIGYAIGLLINYYETKLLVANSFDALAILKADQTY
ncbi:MAG: DUF418 domain-containing protein, partial [Ignavibacteria bacterium]|nr:DUF418 domain-containing protein [Ignavibacteria bacterium]